MACSDCVVANTFNLTPTDNSVGLRNLVLQPGDILFKQDSKPDSFYCISEGIIMLARYVPDLSLVPISFAKNGALVGATSIIAGKYPYTAIALTEARICKFSTNQFEQLTQKGAVLTTKLQLTQQLLHELRLVEQRLSKLKLQNNHDKLLCLLETIQLQIGVDKSGYIPLDLKSETLSQWLGCSAKSITQSIQYLTGKDLLTWHAEKNRFRITGLVA